MTWQTLENRYKELQNIHGDKSLDTIISGGEKENPEICFVFMNPTKRNITSEKSWTGLKAPWIGTKTVWRLFKDLNLFDEDLYNEIYKMKPKDWDYEFTEKVLNEVKEQKIYITNLAKCTQEDARPLPNSVFKVYLELFEKEINLVNPRKIVTFGNQVSSIVLKKPIKISIDRGVINNINYEGKDIETMPTYYPVGQGQRNVGETIKDILKFIKT